MVVLVPKKIKGEKGDTPEGAPGERLRAPAHPANYHKDKEPQAAERDKAG